MGAYIEKWFTIPEDYDIEALAKTVAEWLSAEKGWKTGVTATADGFVIAAKDDGGSLGRLIRRRAESFHLIFAGNERRLRILMAPGEWTPPQKTPGTGETASLFSSAASFAKDAVLQAADTASATLTQLWVDSDLSSSIFDFISRTLIRELAPEDPPGVRFSTSRFVEEMTDVEAVWLAGYRKPDELPLAWLHTDTPVPEKDGTWRYLLTSHRSVLVGFTDTGFTALKALPRQPLAVTDVIGKDRVAIGDSVFKTLLSNDRLFREIAALPGMEPFPRLLETARLHFVADEKPGAARDFCVAMLIWLETTWDDPLVSLSRRWVETVSGADDPPLLSVDSSPEWETLADRLMASTAPEALDHWAADWRLTPEAKIAFAEQLLNLRSEAAGLLLPMISQAAEDARNDRKKPLLPVAADLCLARCLGRLDRQPEAGRILEDRLAALPDESLSDLLPPEDADLTQGDAGQLIRIRVLELLAEMGCGETHQPVRELAVLQPLVPSRLEAALAAEPESPFRRHVRAAHNLLTGAASPDDPSPKPTATARPLTADAIETRLRHPAAREGTAIRKLQNFLATKNVPDHGALKSYARRVTREDHPALFDAVTRGSVILDMSGVEAFIAYGEYANQLRGYEGNPPFLLIGADFIEGSHPCRMYDAELLFAVTAELAHIKFKHERITPREVWEGVFDKAMSLMELVPVLGGYLGKLGKFSKAAIQASEMARKVGGVQSYLSQARDLTTKAQNWYGWIHKGKRTDERPTEEEDFISAFRVMQLTADRAALVACGDLRAAVGAVFKSSPRWCPELPVMTQTGLSPFLKRRDEKNRLIHQHLAIRLAALFSFHFSEDYEALRTACKAEATQSQATR